MALPAALPGQVAPVRGFPADALPALRRAEAVVRATPDTSRLRTYMRAMSEEAHHAGSPGSKRVAEYALARFKSWGLEATIEEFEALLPFPIAQSVELVAPTRFVARMHEPAIGEDRDSADEGMLPPFVLYSPDGDVTGDLVFANYGLPEDYAWLDESRVDLRGKVVIVKYGRGVRSAKIKGASERGAAGVIIYSDPADDGYGRGTTYPGGPWRPRDGVQRGTGADYAAAYSGDPLTPGWGSTKGGRKLPRSEAASLPAIPVVPLSYGDAQPLLAALGGTAVPAAWKGGLPITYHVGPGPARVRVRTRSDWQVRPLYNVVGRIAGAIEPDQWVIFGNHHDGWVHGAHDPVSAAAALMESARGFSELLRTGWRSRRTLVFALWDGEEWGLLGSTEWAESHADELREKGVTYLNTDSYAAGSFDIGGSHTLETFARQVTRDLSDPRTGRPLSDSTFRLSPLGSGTDFEPFLEHLGIASLSYGFDGPEYTGNYHSIYDSYDSFTRFLDPGFAYGRAQAVAVGTFALRLADAPLLPFSFTDAAASYRRFAGDVVKHADQRLGAGRLPMAEVHAAIERLASAGSRYDSAYARAMERGSAWADSHRDALRAINRELYLSERDLLDADGLPRRPWFRHTLYATGLYTGFAPDPLPGVRQGIEAGSPAVAAQQAERVARAIGRMAERADRVAGELARLAPQPARRP